jgi:hypothetical protein
MYIADDVRYEFKKYGPIADVWIARQPPGFAFVDVSVSEFLFFFKFFYFWSSYFYVSPPIGPERG